MENAGLIKNLHALEDASFPKACDNCGARFENETDYIRNTFPYQQEPRLKAIQDKKGRTYLKLIRKCQCGQPILDHFGDRRDNSNQGEIRRKAFDKVVHSLIKQGLSMDRARLELLNHMNNQKSTVLERMGIFNRGVK